MSEEGGESDGEGEVRGKRVVGRGGECSWEWGEEGEGERETVSDKG